MSESEKVGENTASEPREHKRGSGRERVLDAYASILREEGVNVATLDEVARRAEISKGGLLHHFGSKEALLDGLLERIVEENQRDIDQTMGSGKDAVTAYLTSCMNANDPYSETYLAVMKLAGSNNSNVDRVISEILKAWQDALTQRIQDPALARLIQLLGDGLYSHALMKNKPDHLDRDVLELAKALVASKV